MPVNGKVFERASNKLNHLDFTSVDPLGGL
jgi:hypothetical protein